METDRDVAVLLVDDDPDWRRFAARLLESEGMDVTTAGSANEARSTIDEGAYDCVVSDYQMPGGDGLDLLEWVREHDPELPFVLVTGAGSEDVASEAVAAGVTDYVPKRPGRNGVKAMAHRVRKAVETGRLRRRVAESESRYRTVVEQSTDAVFVAQDGELVFANPRAAELTGREREALVGATWGDLLSDPGDAARFGSEADFEIELRTPEGERRIASFSTDSIRYEGETATLATARDVTERRRRERELRAERDLKATFRDALVESSTAEDVEAAVVRELVSRGSYALAWVGEPEAGELRTRTYAGERAYLDSVDLALETGDEPSLWAARRGDPQFVDDVESLFGSAWRDAALDAGYAAAAALPIRYEGLSYGVLAVYATEAGVFDAAERDLLAETAEALAYALDSVGTADVPDAGHVTAVRIRVRASNPLADATADPSFGGVVAVRESVPSEDATALFATVEGAPAEALRERLAERETIQEVTVTDASLGRLRIDATGPTVAGAVGEHGAVTGLTFEDGVADLRFELPPERDVRSVVERLRELGTVEVRSVSARERVDTDEQLRRGVEALTEKQAQALRTAYRAGYFERPREHSADEVAELLDISRSTFLQHLRAAESKTFGALFD